MFIVDSNNQVVIFMVRFLFCKIPYEINQIFDMGGRWGGGWGWYVCVRVCGGGRQGGWRGGGEGHADTEDYVFATREAISLPQTLAVSTEPL